MTNHSKSNSTQFFSFQPELERYTINYVEQEPKLHHRKNISFFYQFHTKNEIVNAYSIIPDGCYDIMFCCNAKKPFAILWTSSFHLKVFDFENGCDYFGVRFSPGQDLFKLNYSMKELVAQQIPLLDVMQVDPSIVEKIGETTSFPERIEIFEKFLNRTFSESRIDRNIVKYSINRIYSSKGTMNIDQISKDSGYSTRYLRKKFEESIGYSPKQFSQIVRFQNALNMLINTNDISLLEITLENLYFDQAHFSKEFKNFTHLTPMQFKVNVSKKLPLHSTI